MINFAFSNLKLACFLLTAVFLLPACERSKALGGQDAVNLTDAFSDSISSTYTKAFREYKFNFPRDHAAHPDFRQEWWYFTGNVLSTKGQRFGYELTIFRFALKPPKQEFITPEFTISNGSSMATNESSWRTSHIYMAHLAVTDIDNDKFYYAEQFSRDAMGLAGSAIIYRDRLEGDSTQLKVWVNDWSIESVGDTVFPIQLLAKADDGFGISLVLNQTKPVVLHGDEGLSIKGDSPGNASYYYSITKMVTVGSITVDGVKASVSGYSWFDREWSTSQLDPEQEGWDWFALQLDDNREIMFFSMRRKDGGLDLKSAGTIVEEDGTSRKLAVNDVNIDVIRHWTSPHSNITYPSGWKISIPSESLELQVTPAVEDQEMNTTIRYWEGSVKVSGKYKNSNRIVAGKGYVELAGYEPG
ncbi:lipocalin-like domain-containing protein [Kaarinaea lacus]